MKRFEVTVLFPELPAAHAVQTVTSSGSNFIVALRRALEEIKKRPHVKGKRIKTAKITIQKIE